MNFFSHFALAAKKILYLFLSHIYRPVLFITNAFPHIWYVCTSHLQKETYKTVFFLFLLDTHSRVLFITNTFLNAFARLHIIFAERGRTRQFSFSHTRNAGDSFFPLSHTDRRVLFIKDVYCHILEYVYTSHLRNETFKILLSLTHFMQKENDLTADTVLFCTSAHNICGKRT